MVAILKKFNLLFFISFVFFINLIDASEDFLQRKSSASILLRDYQNVAIATDLEPDDVMALWIIFTEANQHYEQFGGKYPIDLVIVGEGNSAIKRMRMEKLLKDFFYVPVSIQVVAGKSTPDNIFPYDGEELFDKRELVSIPYEVDQGKKAIQALEAFVETSPQPLIIQLKPAQELVSLRTDLAAKTTVLFYASFNYVKQLKILMF